MSDPLEGWYFDDRTQCWRRAGDVLTDEQGLQWPDPDTDNIPVEVIEYTLTNTASILPDDDALTEQAACIVSENGQRDDGSAGGDGTGR